ncbi:MAG: hypothetical protein ACYS6K_29155 [Planctomycetota bacterium]
MWQAPIIPAVDFNGDGIVDAADMCIMIEHWLTDYPLCDIGPMPWGDGIVDVEDLKVFAEHLFKEYTPARVYVGAGRKKRVCPSAAWRSRIRVL